MFRLCVQNALTQSRSIFELKIPKQLSSRLKSITTSNDIIRRNYAKKVEEQKLEQIYYGPLTPQIRAVKIFSLSSSMAGLVAQPIIIREASTIGSTSLLIALCSVVGFFTFVTPILLHFITKKYVTKIEYNPDTSTYKATTISFFLVHKELDFKVQDIEVPDIPGMFTTLNAKGHPLFIEARHFSEPVHYAKMMGYDKPMDFKLGDIDHPNSDSKSK